MGFVLIVEDEPLLRASLVRGIGKLSGVDVRGVPTLTEALSLIDENPPDLVISDIDLPDRSGIEILGELEQRGAAVPILFVSGYLKDYGAQIPRHANVEVLEKPVELERLRQIVRRRVGTDTAEAQTPFGAADYIQLAGLGNHSVIIEVTKQGEGIGKILVSSGRLWSAHDRDGVGLAALRRLAFDSQAAVDCRTLHEDPGERNLKGTWEHLLMESARVNDEQNRAGAPESGEPEKFDDVFERGVVALLIKDFAESMRLFQRAKKLKPSDGQVEANIRRLEEMGYGPSEEAREERNS